MLYMQQMGCFQPDTESGFEKRGDGLLCDLWCMTALDIAAILC